MKFLKILKYNAKSIWVLTVISLCTSIWAFILQSDAHLPPNLSSDFWDSLSFSWAHWDKWITVLTFVIAAVIGWQGYTRRWENSLPNKITVHFMFDGNCIMSCYRSYLAGEDDIRAWGQQIGSQLSNGQRILALKLIIEQEKMEIINNEFKHYEVTFHLSKEPDIFAQKPYNDKSIVWIFEGNKLSKKIHSRNKTPLSFEEAQSQGEVY